MNRVLFLVLMTVFYFFITGFQSDRFVEDVSHNRLKHSLNRAAHDAALQLVENELLTGKIVFNRARALEVFKATFQDNMMLESNMNPYAGTLFKDAVEIVYEDYVDDSSGVQFPVSYINEQMHFYQVLKGPATIYRVKVKLPQTNIYSYDGDIYKNVIFEYPFY